MKSKILSVNLGEPKIEEWNGVSIKTSMRRSPVPQIEVETSRIVGDAFGSPSHGTSDAILYVFGYKSLLEYAAKLGRFHYDFGNLGENVTVEDLDEEQVSIGDVFRIGQVLAQATCPRTPCPKVNVLMKNPDAQEQMKKSGRSGVYFRILEAGIIKRSDMLERVEEAKIRFTIADVYRHINERRSATDQEYKLALENGAFHQRLMGRWRAP